jgi:PAS domain S-box-containing protein
MQHALRKRAEHLPPTAETPAEQEVPGTVGVWIIDVDGKTVYANATMGEILSVAPAEMMGKSAFVYVFPEDLAAAKRLFQAKVAGDAESFEFRLCRRDGSAVWVEIQGTPMHDLVGRFTGIVGTFRRLERPPRT